MISKAAFCNYFLNQFLDGRFSFRIDINGVEDSEKDIPLLLVAQLRHKEPGLLYLKVQHVANRLLKKGINLGELLYDHAEANEVIGGEVRL